MIIGLIILVVLITIVYFIANKVSKKFPEIDGDCPDITKIN